VLTEYPLRAIIENPEAIERIAKWPTEIGPIRVTFEPKTVIKGQVLVDFIVKVMSGPHRL